MLLIVQRSLHEWYSHQTHFVKSPDDGLADACRMVVNWSIDAFLIGVAKCLSDSGYFDAIAHVSCDVQARHHHNMTGHHQNVAGTPSAHQI